MTICNWGRKGVPPHRAVQLEALTGIDRSEFSAVFRAPRPAPKPEGRDVKAALREALEGIVRELI
jgi:hypothetical protein